VESDFGKAIDKCLEELPCAAAAQQNHAEGDGGNSIQLNDTEGDGANGMDKPTEKLPLFDANAAAAQWNHVQANGGNSIKVNNKEVVGVIVMDKSLEELPFFDADKQHHFEGDGTNRMDKHVEELPFYDASDEPNDAEGDIVSTMDNNMQVSLPDAAEQIRTEGDNESNMGMEKSPYPDPARNCDDTHDEQTEALVCSVCGCTPCEWNEYGLYVINLMTHAFDHTNLLINGRLIDPVLHSIVGGKVARRVAYKCFQYEKSGSISVGKSLPIPKCVLHQICILYP
jgi:hypothetical protein